MRATVMYGAGDVRVENVPDARLVEPTDALVRVTRACICGSDLWPYKQMARERDRAAGWATSSSASSRPSAPTSARSSPATSSSRRSPGRTAPASSASEGLHTSCLHGGWCGSDGVDGGQGEAVRVPQADGTLVALPVGADDALMPSLLTLSDVMGTGHHAARRREGRPGQDRRSRRRRRRRPLRRDRRQAARRRADHHARPSPRPDRARDASSARPTSSASAATRRSSACAS